MSNDHNNVNVYLNRIFTINFPDGLYHSTKIMGEKTRELLREEIEYSIQNKDKYEQEADFDEDAIRHSADHCFNLPNGKFSEDLDHTKNFFLNNCKCWNWDNYGDGGVLLKYQQTKPVKLLDVRGLYNFSIHRDYRKVWQQVSDICSKHECDGYFISSDDMEITLYNPKLCVSPDYEKIIPKPCEEVHEDLDISFTSHDFTSITENPDDSLYADNDQILYDSRNWVSSLSGHVIYKKPKRIPYEKMQVLSVDRISEQLVINCINQ